MRSRWSLFALLTALLLAAAWPAYAGVLTSNSYTYLLKGQEVDLPVDILTQRGTQIVPPELLSRFGVTPQVNGDRILLTRGPVTVEMTLGVATAVVDGRRLPLKTGPVSLSGRLFTPVELLPHLGLQLEVDGKFIHLTDFGAGAPALKAADNFPAALSARTAIGQIRDGSQMGELEITLLSRELLLDPGLQLPWGIRMQLLTLIDDRTLLLTTLRNQAVKAMALDPAKLTLIGATGRQYDYLSQAIAVDGLVTAAVAPGAAKVSVLVYPALADEAAVSLYYDPSGSVIGRYSLK